MPSVDIVECKKEAYEMGYDRFAVADTVDDPELHYFKESAEWCNTILPKLRCMSGYSDSGHGTYTTVETVETEIQEVESHHLLDEIVSAWDMGARDALTGEMKDCDKAKDI